MPPTGIRLALLLLLAATSAEARNQVMRHQYTDHGGTRFSLESYFGAGSTHGAMPFHIAIRNDTNRDLTWRVELTEGRRGGRNLTTQSVQRIEVEAGGEVTRDMLLRFSPTFTTSTYRQLEISATAPGLPPVQRFISYQTNRTFPVIAISRPLARGSLTHLDEYVKNQGSGNQRFAEPFDVKTLPDEWLAYTGLDGLLIDLAGWRSLRDAQRRAVLSWVRLGGRLEVYASSRTAPDLTVEELAIPELEVDADDPLRASFSLGRIVTRSWNGERIETDAAARYSTVTARNAALQNDFGYDWGLADAFGERRFDAAWVFVPLLIFAVLVAPVNLFFFAPKGKRHRLFVTTPLISVGACLLIVVIILLEDGVGGRGMRVVFADLQSHPQEMRLYLSQEQISRTGVMVDPGFTAEAPLDLDPVNLRRSVFNPLSPGSNRSTDYMIDGNDFDGGFFRSRSEQGFSLRSVRPTRARIESTPAEDGGAPRLVSSLPASLETLFLRDGRGRTWRTPPDHPPVAPGDVIPLEAADENTFTDWVTEKTRRFSESQRNRIRRLAGKTDDRYFAVPADGEPFTIATHDAIRWERETILLTGHPVNRNTPTASDE